MMKRLLLALMVCSLCHGEREEDPGDVKEGNFALPTSQQPTSLFGFGQNIVDPHDIIEYTFLEYQLGKHTKFIDVDPSILYGVSDTLSIFFNLPFILKSQQSTQKSSGIEDIYLQAEYLFYKKESRIDALWATVVGALFVPTGSTKKSPATGYGSPSFLLGSTLAYWSVKWYWFVSPFVFLTTKKSGTKFGNQLYYQAGFGRNLVGDPDGWIIMPMVELYGVYSQRDRIKGALDHNSGGNILYVGPSLWTSTKRFVGQAGVLFAATQQLNGSQSKERYFFSVLLGWKFNA